MPFQIIMNLIIAVMWMFLSESYTLSSFIIGYLLGIFLLLLLNQFIPGSFYLRRVFKILNLVLLFIKELITSNIDIVKLVFRKNPEFEPGIFALPMDVQTDWEITLLANLTSLTPGTLAVAVAQDKTHLYVHAMNIDDIDEEIDDIKNTFEKAIKEVTR